jgi:hypothetical protein
MLSMAASFTTFVHDRVRDATAPGVPPADFGPLRATP